MKLPMLPQHSNSVRKLRRDRWVVASNWNYDHNNLCFQCDEVKVVMYFDEERSVTETECAIVNTTTCNQETVMTTSAIPVTECGFEDEERCRAVMSTRLEEECKIKVDRVCVPTEEDMCSITEDSECLAGTGAECVENQDGNDAMVCETILVEDCKNEHFDCLPGSTDPRFEKLNLFIVYHYFLSSDVTVLTSMELLRLLSWLKIQFKIAFLKLNR